MVEPGLALRQPPGFGTELPEPAPSRVVLGDRAVACAAFARSRLPPFPRRGLRAKMDPRHVLDAAPLEAPVIDAKGEACTGISVPTHNDARLDAQSSAISDAHYMRL